MYVMPTPTSARQALIDAMKELLWERGFETTSPGSILERSAVGQGSLYHHFKGKPDLAVAALGEIAAEMKDSVDERLRRHDASPLETILAWIVAPREAVRGCRLGRLVNERSIIESSELSAPIVDYFSTLEKMLNETLHDAQRAGELAADVDVDEVAVLLIAVVQGGYTLSHLHNDPSYMDRATRAAAAMLRADAA
jgi:TetR/AcrR family transcriptional regulator, transcriptional repressor for nem operon